MAGKDMFSANLMFFKKDSSEMSKKECPKTMKKIGPGSYIGNRQNLSP